MKRNIAIAILCALLALGGVASVSANNGLQPWNHRTNPAYFAFGNRSYFELGLSAEASFGNSAIGLGDVFSRTLVIDLDDIYDNTPDHGLRFGSALQTEAHLGVQLGRLGFGVYSDTNSLSRATVPREFIGLVAKGNELDKSYSDSADLLQRSFSQAGGYATYQYRGYVIGAKFGAFAPIVYTDSNAKARYRLETLSDGTVKGEVSATGDVYTAFGDDGGFEGVGFNASLGFVRPDHRGKPLYGGAINNIPIVAARPGYAIEMDQFRFTFESDNLLERLKDEIDPFDTSETEGDVDTRELAPGERPRVHMPVSVSGFYRFAVPVVDVIPAAELVFGEYWRINADVTVEGNFFPLNMLSVGLGYSDFLWHAGAGLRIPLRVFELGLQVRSVGTDIPGVFGGHGLGAALQLALGY